MDTILDRIKAIINLYGFTPSGFERQCGLSYGTITTPIRLNTSIGYHTLSRICSTSHVSAAWLHDGTAPVFNCDCISDHIVDTLFKNGKTIPDFEIATGNPKHSFQREAVLRTMSKNKANVWIEELQKYLPQADYLWVDKCNNENVSAAPSYYKILPEAGISTSSTITLNPGDSIIEIDANFYFVRKEEVSSHWKTNKDYIIKLASETIVRKFLLNQDDNYIRCQQKDSGYCEYIKKSDIQERYLILASVIPEEKKLKLINNSVH